MRLLSAVLIIVFVSAVYCQIVCSFSDYLYVYTIVDNQLFKKKLSDLSPFGQITLPTKAECPSNSFEVNPSSSYAYFVSYELSPYSQQLYKLRLSDLRLDAIATLEGPGTISTLYSDDEYVYPIKNDGCNNMTMYKIRSSDGSLVATKSEVGSFTITGLIDANKVAVLYTVSCDGKCQRFNRLDLNSFQFLDPVTVPNDTPYYFYNCQMGNDVSVYCAIGSNVSRYQFNDTNIELANTFYLSDPRGDYYTPMIFNVDRYVPDILHTSFRVCMFGCTAATYYQFSLIPLDLRYTINSLPSTENAYNPTKLEGIFQRTWFAANNYLVNVFIDYDKQGAICEGVYDLGSRNYQTTCLTGGTSSVVQAQFLSDSANVVKNEVNTPKSAAKVTVGLVIALTFAFL